MWAPQNTHRIHTPHLQNKCRHRHTGVHRYTHSQRQSENLGDVSIFLCKWEGLELMNYGHRRTNRKVWRTKLQERDWKAGTTKDNKVADDGRNSIPFLLTIFLLRATVLSPTERGKKELPVITCHRSHVAGRRWSFHAKAMSHTWGKSPRPG